jgi:hypothetical protein
MTEQIKEYAALLMTISDIAVLIGADEDELKEKIANKTSLESKAYHLGKAETTLAIHRQEIDLAKAGSPMAVELVQEYLTDQSLNENA